MIAAEKENLCNGVRVRTCLNGHKPDSLWFNGTIIKTESGLYFKMLNVIRDDHRGGGGAVDAETGIQSWVVQVTTDNLRYIDIIVMDWDE